MGVGGTLHRSSVMVFEQRGASAMTIGFWFCAFIGALYAYGAFHFIRTKQLGWAVISICIVVSALYTDLRLLHWI